MYVFVCKVYTQSDVIHCLLWPLIVVAICALLFIYVELSSRELFELPCLGKDKRSSAAHNTNDHHHHDDHQHPESLTSHSSASPP